MLLLWQTINEARQSIVHSDVRGRVRVSKEFRVSGESRPEDTRCWKRWIWLEGSKARDVDDTTGTLRLHDRCDQTRWANDVEQVDFHSPVPILIR